jgi:short-subunit dehydrogenase
MKGYETAVITGASSGIGEELAKRLAADGVKVALLARRRERMDATVAAIEAAGGRALAITCDVTDRHQVADAFKQVEAAYGPVDLMIANAGVAQVMSADRLDLDVAERTYKINVFGTLYAISAVLPSMMGRRKGHIVGISSMASVRAYPGLMAYSASKSAMNRELEAVRNRVRKWGVSVSTICPGYIRTEMTENASLPQPMRMELGPAVDKIYKAIMKRKRYYIFPFAMALVTKLMAWLPDFLFDPLAERYDPNL